MQANTLVSVSIYYRNNVANGLGVTLRNDIFTALNSEAERCWELMREEAGNSDALAGMLIDQLDAWLANKPLNEEDTMLCLLNVLMLQQHGYLADDEYNGLQYMYSDALLAPTARSAMFG